MKINFSIEINDEELMKLISKAKEKTEIEINEDYSRWFDDKCPHWNEDPRYNLVFLKSRQSYANDLLKIRRKVFLNEVYDTLGFLNTYSGNIVGWNLDDPNTNGWIDFGIESDVNKKAIEGERNNFLLNFNVDGVII